MKEEVKEFPFAINGFEYQIEEVNTALRNGKLESEIMSWNESITVMRTLDKIKK